MTDRLEALRLEIDSLDGALHELLMKRAELAMRERMEQGPAAGALNPAREAISLRGLARRHSGALAFPAAARVLREVVMASAPLDVHLLIPDDPAAFVELAREYFGTLASLSRVGSAAIVFERVRAGAVGLLPMPGAAAEKWWIRLISGLEGAPRVVARLPVIEPPGLDVGAMRGFVVACQACAPSGEDRTLIAVEANASSSPGSVEKALGAMGLKAQLLDRAAERGLALLLFEGEGYLNEAEFARPLPAPIERVHIVGAYPSPILWPPAITPQPGQASGHVIPLPSRPSS